jgi:hypothetical protein
MTVDGVWQSEIQTRSAQREVPSLIHPTALIEDFHQVASIAHVALPKGSLSVEALLAPHQPRPLPKGKSAVYVFVWGDQCLKVGKVGPKSQARYTSQHYSPACSNSNLAKSILSARDELGLTDVTDASVSDWIKENTDRYNFLLDASLRVDVLTLLEAFLQCRLQPRFEGFDSQR